MKRYWFFLLAALLLPACALADVQTQFWTREQDLYYHFNRACGGAEDAVPISETAARAFDKYSCPACIAQEDAGEDVQAVVRGGTIVLCFSDAWLAQPELTGVFGFSPDDEYIGEAAERYLAECLHGDAYNRFMADFQSDGSAEAYARIPAILAMDGELIMNSRHIGCNWYVVVRPKEKLGDQWKMYWRINGIRLQRSADSLYANFDMQTLEEYKNVRLERGGGNGAIFEARSDTVELFVYRELNTNIAVIYETNADVDFLENAELRIDGNPQGIEIDGYLDGVRGVYCCVLDDAELALLQNGAQVSVWHESPLENADFMDGSYAEVKRGSGDTGIIDGEGNFVVEAKYASIFRPHSNSFRITTPRPFFCTEKNGGLTVLHGETLETILHLEETGDYLRGVYVNPSLMSVFDGRGMKLYSLEDGSVQFALDFDESGEYSGVSSGEEVNDADGYYRVLADGLPKRLVVWQGEGIHAKAWLTDNRGNRVSDDFQRITPLVWSGEKGVFLVESFNTENYNEDVFGGTRQSFFEYGQKYDGGAYGEDWRCGLIDQDGNALTEIKYIAVEALEDGTIWLTDASGNSRIFER